MPSRMAGSTVPLPSPGAARRTAHPHPPGLLGAEENVPLGRIELDRTAAAVECGGDMIGAGLEDIDFETRKFHLDGAKARRHQEIGAEIGRYAHRDIAGGAVREDRSAGNGRGLDVDVAGAIGGVNRPAVLLNVDLTRVVDEDRGVAFVALD